MERIEAGGPMPFDAFMRSALYDPEGGYFCTGPLRSHSRGDFLTSPEISPLFGETIARFVEAEARRTGCPGVDLLEVGAGSGSLLRPLLGAIDLPASACAVEISPAARRALAERIPEARIVASLDEVPAPICGVVLANEVADNLPVAVAVRRGDGWRERRVGVDSGEFAWIETEARPDVARWAQRYAGPVAEAGLVEVQLDAFDWMGRLVGAIERGAVVVIDYGETGDALAHRRTEGTLRTYRGHHLGPDPLAEPGSTDITVDVDIGALVDAARLAGAVVEVETQAEFLERWGLRERLARLRAQELELARSGDALERLRVRSDRTNGDTLLHPRGLGDFRVVMARK